MSKGELIKTINFELDKLNGKIDLKIIKGRSYHKESKRHKFLLAQLSGLCPDPKKSWLDTFVAHVSTFIF